MIIDALFGLISASFLGFLYQDVREIRKKISDLEEQILKISLIVGRRKADRERE